MQRRGPSLAVAALALVLAACGGGGGDTEGVATASYQSRVSAFKVAFGKDDAWEQWMLANADRYESALFVTSSRPPVLDLSYRYASDPVGLFDPAWTSEEEHMARLEAMGEACFPGMDLRATFEGDRVSSFANVSSGIDVNLSNVRGKEIELYHETAFCHEFSHRLGLVHHYDTPDQIGEGLNFPPGEVGCVMDRNAYDLCSACRTALGISLDLDYAEEARAAIEGYPRRARP
jgi:hypothetical protein